VGLVFQREKRGFQVRRPFFEKYAFFVSEPFFRGRLCRPGFKRAVFLREPDFPPRDRASPFSRLEAVLQGSDRFCRALREPRFLGGGCAPRVSEWPFSCGSPFPSARPPRARFRAASPFSSGSAVFVRIGRFRAGAPFSCRSARFRAASPFPSGSAISVRIGRFRAGAPFSCWSAVFVLRRQFPGCAAPPDRTSKRALRTPI